MHLTTAQLDRACGVAIGSAVGDALGAGYEFTRPAPDLIAEMIGGGLGNFAPGQWTDDTDQAAAILRIAASGEDLRTPAALDAIAQAFRAWFAGSPPDVGIQTGAVFFHAGRTANAAKMTAAARHVHETTGRSAGNGSLMRTGPVALAYLDDPAGLVEAAQAVSQLTHYQREAWEACAVWCLMIRHAVLTGELPTFADIAPWVPSAEYWRAVLEEAESKPPSEFTENGWSVGALQAAWSAITHASQSGEADGLTPFERTLHTAIRIGHDTDTVAAIAGALVGGLVGMSAIPALWRRPLHGWPDLTGIELEALAFLAARHGETGSYGWPQVEHIDYAPLQYGLPACSPHPHDADVYLTSATVLDDLPAGVDAVVSLCLTGRQQVPSGVELINFRLIDKADPAENPNLDYVLADAARTIAQLRAEGRRVVVQCVAAQSRTPAVGIAYSMLRGVPLSEALPAVCNVLPAADPNPGFRRALQRLDEERSWMN